MILCISFSGSPADSFGQKGFRTYGVLLYFELAFAAASKITSATVGG